MQQIPDIRQMFRPVQPTVENAADHVTYIELLPDLHLTKYIYCYWQLSSLRPLTAPFTYRVVADGCIDLYFSPHTPEAWYIMGFSTTYTEFPLEDPFNYIGIRFLPAAFPLLFRVNAGALTNRFELLEQVLPSLRSNLVKQVKDMNSLLFLKPVFDASFGKVLSGTTPYVDTRLFDALDTILRARGMLPVESTLNTGISSRQLRRLFDYYIGGPPKTFSKVVRFQHILHGKPSAQSLRENKLFFDAGYYDQAHFIKEFRTMYGLTPAIALK